MVKKLFTGKKYFTDYKNVKIGVYAYYFQKLVYIEENLIKLTVCDFDTK